MIDRKHKNGLEPFRGHWGLITGASSGIGLEFARRAASSGLNLVLVARHHGPLKVLACELEKANNVHTHVISSDLAEPKESIRIANILREEKIKIRFLCHAAGVGHWGPFLEGDAGLYSKIIDLNTNALTDLLLQFHSDLASHETSAVVIVSSRAGCHPVPTMAVYAAAKAFSQSLSQSLFREWEKDGIYVQALMPGAVDTALDANQKLLAAGVLLKNEMESAYEVVAASLRGFLSKTPRVITGKGKTLQRLFSAVLPRRLFLRSVETHFSINHLKGDQTKSRE